MVALARAMLADPRWPWRAAATLGAAVLPAAAISPLEAHHGKMGGLTRGREERGLGRIGDAFFYYIGTYTSESGRWKGQILNLEHTPAKGENPVFGGHEVGIGFSGTCDDQGALLEATALAGKRSLRMTAVLKLMRPA